MNGKFEEVQQSKFMTPQEQIKADAIEEWFKEATNRANRSWYQWAEGTHQ